jgi:hypothetical protein
LSAEIITASLALGPPVPPAIVATTHACREYHTTGRSPHDAFRTQIVEHMKLLEEDRVVSRAQAICGGAILAHDRHERRNARVNRMQDQTHTVQRRNLPRVSYWAQQA